MAISQLALLTKEYVANNKGAVYLRTPVFDQLKSNPGIADVATVQVKQPHGRNVLIAKMRPTDTIGSIRSEISCHYSRLNLDEINFELRLAYPPRSLPSSMTLQEAGLVPNGTIHMKCNA